MSFNAAEQVELRHAGSPPAILFGPPGHTEAHDTSSLMRRLGCVRVLVDWDGLTPLQPGDLAITSMPLAQLERVCVAPTVPADTLMLWAPRMMSGERG